MADRTIETILAEWRAAEAERPSRPGDIAHDKYIARLRDEYHASVDARLTASANGWPAAAVRVDRVG